MKDTYVSVVNETDFQRLDKEMNREIKGAARNGYVLRDIKFSTAALAPIDTAMPEQEIEAWAVLIFDACADVTANGKE